MRRCTCGRRVIRTRDRDTGKQIAHEKCGTCRREASKVLLTSAERSAIQRNRRDRRVA